MISLVRRCTRNLYKITKRSKKYYTAQELFLRSLLVFFRSTVPCLRSPSHLTFATGVQVPKSATFNLKN